MTQQVGQKHYVIARDDGGKPRYWRSRGNQHQPSGWTFSLAECRKYRTPGDAARAARQIEELATFKVLECQTVTGRVCYRITCEENPPHPCGELPAPHV